MTNIEKIRKVLSDEELLCQLAEEATELAQAALKLRRCINGKNPTPVTKDDALGNLIEELSDVEVAKSVYFAGCQPELGDAINCIVDLKIDRWMKRLDGGDLQ